MNQQAGKSLDDEVLLGIVINGLTDNGLRDHVIRNANRLNSYQAVRTELLEMARTSRVLSQMPTPMEVGALVCCQVPHLPRKQPRRPRRYVGTQRATRASPVPYVPRLPRKVTIHVAKNKLCDETVHKLCVQVPRLPRETKVDVSKCHACHAKCSYMSPSATPATQKAAATTAARGNPARHQSQPSAIRATPATQSDDPCM